MFTLPGSGSFCAMSVWLSGDKRFHVWAIMREKSSCPQPEMGSQGQGRCLHLIKAPFCHRQPMFGRDCGNVSTPYTRLCHETFLVDYCMYVRMYFAARKSRSKAIKLGE